MIDVVIKEKRKDFVMMRVLWREWICYQGEEKKTVKNGRRVACVRDDDQNGRRVTCVFQTRVFVMMIRMEGECNVMIRMEGEWLVFCKQECL